MLILMFLLGVFLVFKHPVGRSIQDYDERPVADVEAGVELIRRYGCVKTMPTSVDALIKALWRTYRETLHDDAVRVRIMQVADQLEESK